MTLALLALDPGKRHCGWAYESREGVLRAGYWEHKGDPPLCYSALAEFLHRNFEPDVVVCERMMSYPGSKAKANPNDLLPLSCMAGVVFGVFYEARHFWPLPREWKGTIPKTKHHARLLKEAPYEHKVYLETREMTKKQRADMMDGYGLLQWLKCSI